MRPNAEQSQALERLREEVLEQMGAMSFIDEGMLNQLRQQPLGVLRKSATQRHGVTRWNRLPEGHLEVASVELHPVLLQPEWWAYAAFVLYHEFLHALGWRAHDPPFRALESCWPDAQAAARGPSFTHAMRASRASWMWRCPQCEQSFPRQRKASGRYLCRTCRCVLEDVAVEDAQ